MREIRPSGSEGGGAQTNESYLPLFLECPCRDEEGARALPRRATIQLAKCVSHSLLQIIGDSC